MSTYKAYAQIICVPGRISVPTYSLPFVRGTHRSLRSYSQSTRGTATIYYERVQCVSLSLLNGNLTLLYLSFPSTNEEDILGSWTGCRTGNREMGRMGSTDQCGPFCPFCYFLCDILSIHPVFCHHMAFIQIFNSKLTQAHSHFGPPARILRLCNCQQPRN